MRAKKSSVDPRTLRIARVLLESIRGAPVHVAISVDGEGHAEIQASDERGEEVARFTAVAVRERLDRAEERARRNDENSRNARAYRKRPDLTPAVIDAYIASWRMEHPGITRGEIVAAAAHFDCHQDLISRRRSKNSA